MRLTCGGGVGHIAPLARSVVPRVIFGEAALGIQLAGGTDGRVGFANVLLRYFLMLIGAEVDGKVREGLPICEYLLDHVLLLLLSEVFHILEPIAMPGLVLKVPLSLPALPIETHEHVHHSRATRQVLCIIGYLACP